MPAAGRVIGRPSSFRSMSGAPRKDVRRAPLHAGRALERETDRDEVVRRPRTGVLEGELALVPLADLLDLTVEGLGLLARDEERRVHDHLVADHLVGPRRDGGVL